MKYIFFLFLTISCLSFNKKTNFDFYGLWKVKDIINVNDIKNIKQLALHKMIKVKISEQNIQIKINHDSIKMIKNYVISEKGKIIDFQLIKNDSATFKFNKYSCSIKLTDNRNGQIIVDNKNIFFIQKE